MSDGTPPTRQELEAALTVCEAGFFPEDYSASVASTIKRALRELLERHEDTGE